MFAPMRFMAISSLFVSVSVEFIARDKAAQVACNRFLDHILIPSATELIGHKTRSQYSPKSNNN